MDKVLSLDEKDLRFDVNFKDINFLQMFEEFLRKGILEHLLVMNKNSDCKTFELIFPSEKSVFKFKDGRDYNLVMPDGYALFSFYVEKDNKVIPMELSLSTLSAANPVILSRDIFTSDVQRVFYNPDSFIMKKMREGIDDGMLSPGRVDIDIFRKFLYRNL